MLSEADQLTAEQRFRQAFERLKAGRPVLLPRTTPVSQNNIAKEAGCDPSALRKSRFPSLVREIQAYVEIYRQQRPSKRQSLLKQRTANSEGRLRLEEVARQRDRAQSQLVSAQRRIVELIEELKTVKGRLNEARGPK